MDTGRRTPSTSSPETVARHWYRDLSIRARIFGLTAVLLLGLVASTVTGMVNGNRVSELHAESQAAVAVQQEVEAARYNLLWAANWQNITAWRARVDGGAVAAAPDGDNVAFYTDGATGFEKLFSIDRSLLDSKAQASLDTIQENWTVMSDYNDQIFQLWAAGKLDEGDAMSTGEKWDVFYVLDQAMTELVKSVDARATSAKQQADDAEAFTETIAAVVTALAVLLGLLVAFVVSRGIVRGIQGRPQRARAARRGRPGGPAAGAWTGRGRPDGGGTEQRRLHHGGHRRRDRRLGRRGRGERGGAVGVVGADLGVGAGDQRPGRCRVRCGRGGVAQRRDRRRRCRADGCLDPGDRVERGGGQRGGGPCGDRGGADDGDRGQAR